MILKCENIDGQENLFPYDEILSQFVGKLKPLCDAVALNKLIK